MSGFRRRLMMARKQQGDSYDYITDGLKLHLDGMWNGGVGVHLDSTDTWVDLSQFGNDATTINGTQVTFGKDYASCANNDGFVSLVGIPAAHDLTVEVWFKSGFTGANRGVGCWGYGSPQRFSFSCWRNKLQYMRGGSLNGGVSFYDHAAFTYNKENTIFRLYNSGVETTTYTVDLTNTRDQTPAIGINVKFDSNTYSSGDIYMVRVYDRTLSAEEIAYNTALDNKRLGK